jgi:uncharacterized protein YbaA (DUF1428 family)
MSYVDRFVISVPTANKQAFIDQAREFDTMLMQFGALRVMECWGDDVLAGKLTDLYRTVQAADAETVVFSWVDWPDKATRAAGFTQTEALMATDPRFKDKPMAFDGKRVIFGGFSPVVEL